MKKIKPLSRAEIRSLLVKQKGRCALSGEKITPKNVALDHIIPISRQEFEKKKVMAKLGLLVKKLIE